MQVSLPEHNHVDKFTVFGQDSVLRFVGLVEDEVVGIIKMGGDRAMSLD